MYVEFTECVCVRVCACVLRFGSEAWDLSSTVVTLLFFFFLFFFFRENKMHTHTEGTCCFLQGFSLDCVSALAAHHPAALRCARVQTYPSRVWSSVQMLFDEQTLIQTLPPQPCWLLFAHRRTFSPLSGVIKSVRMQTWPTTKRAVMSQAPGVGTATAKIGGPANERRGR